MRLQEIKHLSGTPLCEAYKKTITREEAIEYLKRNCSDALKTINTPIVRGDSTISTDFTIVTGEDGGRASRNTSNHYSIIMDEFLPKLGYPRRQASIICASNESIDYARKYGNLHAVFPTNGAKIGVSEGEDLWHTRIKLGGKSTSIHSLNAMYINAGVSGGSYAALISDLDKIRHGDSPSRLKTLLDGIPNNETTEEAIRYAYTEPFTLTTTATPQPYNRGEHEVWIGRPCLLVKWDMYLEILKDWHNETI